MNKTHHILKRHTSNSYSNFAAGKTNRYYYEENDNYRVIDFDSQGQEGSTILFDVESTSVFYEIGEVTYNGTPISRGSLGYQFIMPKHIFYGENALSDAGEQIASLGKKALIVTDPMMVKLGNVKKVTDILDRLTGERTEVLHVIGGGTRNRFLMQYTANAVGIPVISGPAECTALGNVLLQLKAAGLAPDLDTMRRIAAASVETVTYMPEDKDEWEEAYIRFLNIRNNYK